MAGAPGLRFGDWVPVGAPMDHRWLEVKDERATALSGLASVHDIHIWTRRNIEYRPDTTDEWSPPQETLDNGHGDCEDFAILERALLIAAGWPASKMWLVIAEDLVAHQTHAMLVYDGFLLDCRADKITKAEKAKDYRPVVAFCDDAAVTFGRRR